VRLARRIGVACVLLIVLGAAGAAADLRAGHAAPPSDPVLAAIAKAASGGGVTPTQAAGYRQTYMGARAETGRLPGTRGLELGSVVAIVRGIAARGSLTATRMPLVFLTLQRNLEWWSVHGPPVAGSGTEPAARGRVCKPLARAANFSFPGSGIVYEYYPGLGLQLQVNATFATVNALLTQGSRAAATQAGAILDEMLPLASLRDGRLTWEYEFPFEGAQPPWTSGLSQATAIEALTRAAIRLGRPDFLATALRLARLMAVPPPVGVHVTFPRGGTWFLLYSFDPGQLVLNPDLDAVIALHDLRLATHSRFVARLARSGLLTLERNIARFNTGRWSLYAYGGPLADLNYHAVNLELAQKLCQRTGAGAICRSARSFQRELNTRCPVVTRSHLADRTPVRRAAADPRPLQGVAAAGAHAIALPGGDEPAGVGAALADGRADA
jgi:D-glucuronyl C5-epimerase C-terminus